MIEEKPKIENHFLMIFENFQKQILGFGALDVGLRRDFVGFSLLPRQKILVLGAQMELEDAPEHNQ